MVTTYVNKQVRLIIILLVIEENMNFLAYLCDQL
jgi:hypothetical protein